MSPSGPLTNGTYWLDTGKSTYGMFRSNGNPNSALAWSAVAPTVINNSANLETVVQGYTAGTSSIITSASASVISIGGVLVINGVNINVTTSDSITSIISKIVGNSLLAQKGISATIFTKIGKLSTSSYGDIYNIRIVASGNSTVIDLTGTTTSVLSDLGFASATPTNSVQPAASFGTTGTLAIDVLTVDSGEINSHNRVWEKLTITSTYETQAWWFLVGSTDTAFPGWGWSSATPTIITGTTPNPVFTTSDSFNIKVDGSLYTVTLSGTTLASLISNINSQLSSTNCIASIYTLRGNSYLRITNFGGGSIYLKDNDTQSFTHHPLKDAGISATQTYFGSITGTITNPSFVAPTFSTASAVVSAAGTGYVVGDVLYVVGGTHSVQSALTVSTLQAVSYTITTAGTGFAVNDTLTFSTGFDVGSPLIMQVQAIGGSGEITDLAITQSGSISGSVPSNPVTPDITSGSGVSATISLVWGVKTVSVSNAGNYTVYPTNPASVTGGTGTNATFTLTSQYLTGDVFTIDVGSGPITVHVPTNNTVNGVAGAINTAFSSGPIVASVVSNKLVITNTNGTNFTVQDISGSPLNGAGIPVGFTYGRLLTYQGYSPSLTVPNTLSMIASGSIWINTTPGDRGANYVLKEFVNGAWVVSNVTPNTGTVPMYSSDSAANAGFGASKAIGSIYLKYNSEGTTPSSASHQFFVWSDVDNTLSWQQFAYTASNTAPLGPPSAGTLWYNTNLMADIMVGNGVNWQGYRQAYPATNPTGVMISGSAPTVHSDYTALVDYDLWLDSSKPAYPTLYRYVAASSSWVLVNNTDHSSPAGIIFADARANTDGTASTTTQAALALSNYVDSDAPNAELYPAGMMLYNTRFSTNNVKIWTPGYLPSAPVADRWVTISGNKPDGTPYSGSAAQRTMIVRALQSTLESSQDIRAESTYFNLIATPGYIELLPDMINLNTDKNNVAFIIADTPSTLSADGTSIVSWATNAADVSYDSAEGLISASPYAALYYPWALATNLDGSNIFVPPSVMALNTYAYNDQTAYPWFAPAGFNRGLVSNALSVGYLDSNANYVPVVLNQGQRDVLYTNKINPIAYIPNRGLVIWGQITLDPIDSELNRVNVSRLTNYLNYSLDNLAKPYMFEPNDHQTWMAVTASFNNFMNNLIGLRGLYDFSVVCDASNNTPSRIAQKQLWIDVAVQPEIDIEFIYIPLRILSPGSPLPGANRSGNLNQ